MRDRQDKELHRAFLYRLQLAMSRIEMTRAQMARRLGTTKSAVSDWFNRGSMPSGEVMVRLPAILGVTADYLVTGDVPQIDVRGLSESIEVLRALRDERLRRDEPSAQRPGSRGRSVAGPSSQDVESAGREADRPRTQSRQRRRRSQGA